ncbi:DNA polymerase III subunit gamma/tau [Umboniibacter marinipuniceus]|uniref:DNA polymerase III subunit gamma/tau n=1 Tax=Umboniibacter marinipuniceus TaxID=569599 RepID=A0A3M0A2J5_9GAMM|nr:DNA polymerase III subunit gamma/tau [Umboniibacter marinipuniceus]RMA78867.1 DNA polymerase III gamma subunit /DNA polymerase III tau subunit [Umboniibacter marinipuniceus]
MSYQVLARKYRPANFHETVGQEHVLRALINALDNNRLHHAYLFTGTRGVGKTTIARILAKCLNCERGVSSKPCGECNACLDIAAGRFIDLIEVDAASRTKVEDTRELLDNIQYAPTAGRFKVYLIDEVHMLSNHSFNALLKTLEEPPPHVKFLLATTDPQKLPITVLSRCLQLSLKNMIPERIVSHLETVLSSEALSYEEEALWSIAQAADGSMRDALSLTDQAIAFGDGSVQSVDVNAMLGTIDRGVIQQLLQLLIDGERKALMSFVAQLSQQAPDFSRLLSDLTLALHKLAMLQVVPDYPLPVAMDAKAFAELAQRVTAEDVQLFYQIGVQSLAELRRSPDEMVGFEMVLLRMLAFRPQGVIDIEHAPDELPEVPTKKTLPQSDEVASTGAQVEKADIEVAHLSSKAAKPLDERSESAADDQPPWDVDGLPASASTASKEVSTNNAVIEPSSSLAEVTATETVPTNNAVIDPASSLVEATATEAGSINNAVIEPASSLVEATATEAGSTSIEVPEAVSEAITESVHDFAQGVNEPPIDHKATMPSTAGTDVAAAALIDSAIPADSPKPTETTVGHVARGFSLDSLTQANFPEFALRLRMIGPAGSALHQMSLQSVEGNQLNLVMDSAQSMLLKARQHEQLTEAFSVALGETVILNIVEGDPGLLTASLRRLEIDTRRREQAIAELNSDPVIQFLNHEMGAKVLPHTVVSLAPEEF